MAIILMAQIQMAFNVNAIPVSIGPIVEDLGVSSSTVGSALVFYSLSVAALVMLGAKLGTLFGARRVFQVAAVAHGLAMLMMALARNEAMMLSAQALAGVAAAALVPTLVVLIAANYRGSQQAQALGLLAGAPAISGVMAFLIAGWLGTASSWRYSFGLLFAVSLAVLALSRRLKPVHPDRGVTIDTMGAVLAALSVILISLGFNNLNAWGIVLAKPAAPFSLLGLSPAPFMVVVGVVLAQAFLLWTHRRGRANKTPILSLEVVDSKHEQSAILAFFMISALGPAVNFLIPLYIQIVQGRTSLQTSVSMIPYTLSIFASAVLVVRSYQRLTPRQIARLGFIMMAVGLTILAFAIRGSWGQPGVILGLIVLGLGEGALLTLLFNVLVSSSPKELAGDVGAMRGVANNLSTALGTAFASVAAITLLALFVSTALAGNPTIPPSLKQQVALDNIDFVSNDQLVAQMAATTDATAEQKAEAVRINTTARANALKASFLILAAIALLAILPTGGLPGYKPDELLDPEVPAAGANGDTADPLPGRKAGEPAPAA
jgi:MFS family permease